MNEIVLFIILNLTIICTEKTNVIAYYFSNINGLCEDYAAFEKIDNKLWLKDI